MQQATDFSFVGSQRLSTKRSALFIDLERFILYPNCILMMAWQNLNSVLLFSAQKKLTLQLHFPGPPRLFLGRGAFQQREIVKELKSSFLSYVPCIIHVSCRAVSVTLQLHQGQCDSVLLAVAQAVLFLLSGRLLDRGDRSVGKWKNQGSAPSPSLHHDG